MTPGSITPGSMVPESSIKNLSPGDQYLANQLNEKLQKQAQADKLQALNIKAKEQSLDATSPQRELRSNVRIAQSTYNNTLTPIVNHLLELKNRPVSGLPGVSQIEAYIPGTDLHNTLNQGKQVMLNIIQNLIKGSSGSRAQQLIEQERKVNEISPWWPESKIRSAFKTLGDLLSQEGVVRAKGSEQQHQDLLNWKPATLGSGKAAGVYAGRSVSMDQLRKWATKNNVPLQDIINQVTASGAKIT